MYPEGSCSIHLKSNKNISECTSWILIWNGLFSKFKFTKRATQPAARYSSVPQLSWICFSHLSLFHPFWVCFRRAWHTRISHSFLWIGILRNNHYQEAEVEPLTLVSNSVKFDTSVKQSCLTLSVKQSHLTVSNKVVWQCPTKSFDSVKQSRSTVSNKVVRHIVSKKLFNTVKQLYLT